MKMADQKESTAQITVPVSKEQCFHDNREAALLTLTYFIPKPPSKKYQIHRENKTGKKKHQHAQITAPLSVASRCAVAGFGVHPP